MLPNLSVKLTLYTVSSLISLINVVCLLVHKKAAQTKQIKGAYGVAVAFVNITNTSYAFYLLVLWSWNNFLSSGKGRRHLEWQSALLCFLMFGTNSFFSFLSPFSICFLSLARCRVVVCPLESKFKDFRFVCKCIVCMSSVAVVCTILVSITMWHISGKVPANICAPFFDPTHSFVITTVLTWLLVCAQLFSVVFVMSVHSKVFSFLGNRQKLFLTNKPASRRSLLVQIIILNISNMLSWVPSSVIYLSAMFLPQYPLVMMVWTEGAVKPVHTVVSPVVFTALALR